MQRGLSQVQCKKNQQALTRFTPDEFRGRISAVYAMFAFGGPLLGQFESGVVANYISPQFSVVSGGIACILATLAIAAIVPESIHTRIQ